MVKIKTRCRIPIRWTFGRIPWHVITEPLATLQGVIIPSAILKIVFGHILFFLWFFKCSLGFDERRLSYRLRFTLLYCHFLSFSFTCAARAVGPILMPVFHDYVTHRTHDICTSHRNTRSHSSLVQYATETHWIKTLLRVHPWTSSRTIYPDLLSVYLPIGVISQLPREFADYQAEAETYIKSGPPSTELWCHINFQDGGARARCYLRFQIIDVDLFRNNNFNMADVCFA